MKTLQKIWSVIKGREIPSGTKYVKLSGYTYGILPDGKIFVVLHGNNPI